jgi:phage terminase large subunit GpA-like protein
VRSQPETDAQRLPARPDDNSIVTEIFFRAARAAIPDVGITVSQWADKYRVLSAERSARPGRWSTDLVPYTREIMDACSDSATWKVIFVKPNQIAGTEIANNVIGHRMDAKPSSVLYSCETEDKAKAWSVECLAPMIRDTPALANKVHDPRTRDSGNTIKSKKYPGGHLAIGWATSPSTASSRPREVVILDEYDAFKPTSEGDYGELAALRTDTFEDKLIFIASTPRNRLENPEGVAVDAPRFSPIEREFQESDRRFYHVACPHCREYQKLEWDRVKWDDEPQLAWYVCVNGCVIEEEEKTDMLARGKWIAEAPFRGIAGFFLNKLYSPFVTWGECADKYVKAKRSGDPEKMRVWINTTLAQGYEADETPIETNDLVSRREDYYRLVPNGVLIITCGVDVQGNRLELEIVGWGLNNESWSLDYIVILGDPALDEVWLKLRDEVLLREFVRQDDLTMKIWCTCIDSGGHHTNQVYKFARENSGRRVFAIKGSATPGQPLIGKPTLKGRPPIKLYIGGTETAKDNFSACLRVTKHGPGFCHFPIDDQAYGEDYFKQILSERPVANKKGVRVWQKLKTSLRNEALDCRVYARFALAILNPNFRTLARLLRERLAKVSDPGAVATGSETPPSNGGSADDAPDGDQGSSPTVSEGSDADEDIRPPRKKKRRRRGGGFATSWKKW